MVAITTYHECHILQMITLEVLAIVVGTLCLFPLVKHLVNNKHAKAVTSMKECFGGQVMTTAHGVKASRLHQFHFMCLSAVNACTTQETVVVVYTATTELDGFPIELEAILCRKTDSTNAERNRERVFFFARLADIKLSSVAVGIIQRP